MTPPLEPQTVPMAPAKLRRLIGRRYRAEQLEPRDILPILMLTDTVLVQMAQVVNEGLHLGLSVSEMSAELQGIVRGEILRRFVVAIRYVRRQDRHGRFMAVCRDPEGNTDRQAEISARVRAKARQEAYSRLATFSLEPTLEQLRRRWQADAIPIALQQRWEHDYIARQLGA